MRPATIAAILVSDDTDERNGAQTIAALSARRVIGSALEEPSGLGACGASATDETHLCPATSTRPGVVADTGLVAALPLSLSARPKQDYVAGAMKLDATWSFVIGEASDHLVMWC